MIPRGTPEKNMMTIESLEKKIGDTLELQGGRLEDFWLIEMAEASGRIAEGASLNERAVDARAFLEFLGWKFVDA